MATADTDAKTAKSTESIKQRAISSTIWSIGGYGIQNIVRLLGNLILTRLLAPEMFGLMAIVQAFIIGLHFFSDIGIGLSIIQNKKGEDPEFYNTAWTLQAIRGIGLWVGSFLIAWPLAAFYGKPELRWLLPAVGTATLFAGFQSTALFILNRKILVSKLIWLELVAQLLSLVVMVTWAVYEQTIMAIVAGSIFGSIVKTVVSHFLIKGHHNRFTWNRAVGKEIFTFGKWIFVSTAVTFLASQADQMILGKLLTMNQLGVYAIALTFSEIPKQLIDKLGAQVIFPVVSRFSGLTRKELREKIISKRWWLLGSCATAVTFLACFGDLLVILLYDDRYRNAAVMLPILSLGIWPFVLHSSIDPCLLAIGKPSYKALGNLSKFIFMVLAMPLFFGWKGVMGAIIAIALNDLPTLCAVQWGLKREGLSVVRQDIIVTVGCCTAIGIILWLRQFCGYPVSFTLTEV